MKHPLETISSFSYGTFLVDLHGLWISNKEIWFQWYLVQAKIIEPICLQEYQFMDEYPINTDKVTEVVDNSSDTVPTKYDKMLKMGVPKEAVERQKALDMNMSVKTQKVKIPYGSIPPPPPPPSTPSFNPSSVKSETSGGLHKIDAKDLLSVKLKSASERQITGGHTPSDTDNKEMGYFEPPSLGDIQTMLKKLKPISK